MFQQLSNGLHCSQKHFYSVPFLGVSLSSWFFFSFDSLMNFTLQFNSFSFTVCLLFFLVFPLLCFSHLTRIGLSLRSHLAITAAGSFEHLLSFSSLSSLSILLFHFATSMPLFSLRHKQSACAALYPPKLVNSKGRGEV